MSERDELWIGKWHFFWGGDDWMVSLPASKEPRPMTVTEGQLFHGIAQLKAERDELAEKVYELPELNMGNYSDEDVLQLNNGAIELWGMFPDGVRNKVIATALSEQEEKE